MNDLIWRFCTFVAGLLDPAEREFVCGDLAESGQQGLSAMLEILGLVLRRRMALLADGRTWAAISIVVLGGTSLSFFLARFGTGLSLQLSTYWKFGVHYETGVAVWQDAFHLTILALTLFVLSWASGFVLASFSGRSLWLTVSLFYVAVQESYFVQLVHSSSIRLALPLPFALGLRLLPTNPVHILVFLVAVLWGAWRGRLPDPIGNRNALFFVASASALLVLLIVSDSWYETALQRWSEGAWQPAPWPSRLLPVLLVAWPVACIPSLAGHPEVKKVQ